jgi:raffinose/stachyose/melibiose transport system permease protein
MMGKSRSVSKLLVFTGLFIMSASFLYPIIFMFLNALKTEAEYIKNPFGLPSEWSLDNFTAMITRFNILSNYKNSLIVTVGACLSIIAFSVFASYAFAKLRFRGKSLIYLLIIGTMFIPIQVTMIPQYVMFSRLRLINSYFGVILSYVSTGLPSSMLLMSSTFRGISDEMLEAVEIDGGGYFSTVRHVIVPMGMPAIAISLIFGFIAYWGDLLVPMLFLSKLSKRTVMVALNAIVDKTDGDPTYQLAGLVISIIPTLLVYLACQRFIVRGLTVGSIK